MSRATLALLALAGCAEDSPQRRERPDPTVPDDPCAEATAVPTPADGAVDQPLILEPAFLLDPEDPDANLTLVADGSAIPGTVERADGEIWFHPDQPLLADTEHVLELEWACGSASSAFTTVAGSPGAAFQIDTTSGTWVEPPAVGALFADLLEERQLVFEVLNAVDGALIDARLGSAVGATQDRCAPTTDSFGNPFGGDPDYQLAFDYGYIDLAGEITRLDAIGLRGTFDATHTNTGPVDLTGSLDMLWLEDLVGTDPCALLITFGIPCVACPTGGQTCVDVEIQAMTAGAWGGQVVERTPADVQADPACP